MGDASQSKEGGTNMLSDPSKQTSHLTTSAEKEFCSEERGPVEQNREGAFEKISYRSNQNRQEVNLPFKL